jgi:hypothetical protein
LASLERRPVVPRSQHTGLVATYTGANQSSQPNTLRPTFIEMQHLEVHRMLVPRSHFEGFEASQVVARLFARPTSLAPSLAPWGQHLRHCVPRYRRIGVMPYRQARLSKIFCRVPSASSPSIAGDLSRFPTLLTSPHRANSGRPPVWSYSRRVARPPILLWNAVSMQPRCRLCRCTERESTVSWALMALTCES